jgi:hypothetical protein
MPGHNDARTELRFVIVGMRKLSTRFLTQETRQQDASLRIKIGSHSLPVDLIDVFGDADSGES